MSNLQLTSNQLNKIYSNTDFVNKIIVYEKYTLFKKNIKHVVETNKIIPEILCQIEKVDVFWKLYIVKWGEIGLFKFCIL